MSEPVKLMKRGTGLMVLLACFALPRPAWAQFAVPIVDLPWDARDVSIAGDDDDDVEYTLPFTFPFFGRDIVAINVNTNGLIELLEAGESCNECDDYETHDDGDHVGGGVDVIFAANDDLDSGVLIEGDSGDRVEIIWIGTTHSDADFETDELTFKVILFPDGRIIWKFFDMDWSGHGGDLFSGVYDEVADVEIEIPGGTTAFTGEGVNEAFEFDPTIPDITSIPWNANDVSVAGDDDDDVEYTLPCPITFPGCGRQIEKINVNTNGLVELLEAGESCNECSDYNTHKDGDHVSRDIDAIFVANDDLKTGVLIEGDFDDRVEIIWIGTTYDDDDFESDELTMKLILFCDGRIVWKFFDMDWNAHDGDLFSGLYDEVADAELEVPGGSQSFDGEGVNTAFLFDPDGDGDGTPDCADGCVDDPNKIEPGDCGCGNADVDTDGDGTSDCVDDCPNDPNKIEPGDCGCGVDDVDTDGDGTPDCMDDCPNDPNKTDPGDCGCGVPDEDLDGDGTSDCPQTPPPSVEPNPNDCGEDLCAPGAGMGMPLMLVSLGWIRRRRRTWRKGR